MTLALSDAKIVKNSPCSFCGKKSTARIRLYNDMDADKATKLEVIGSCDIHHKNLGEILKTGTIDYSTTKVYILTNWRMK
ncbi:MAG: hypothetical protein KC483_11295 [Nitrosarchaeum sp.]|nr:hypothetical protein [Nitrosarchaeum sp.]